MTVLASPKKIAADADPVFGFSLAELAQGRESWGDLTPREVMVAERLAMGAKTRGVATELGIAPKTVDIHRANVRRKLRPCGVSLTRLYFALRASGHIETPLVGSEGK